MLQSGSRSNEWLVDSKVTTLYHPDASLSDTCADVDTVAVAYFSIYNFVYFIFKCQVLWNVTFQTAQQIPANTQTALCSLAHNWRKELLCDDFSLTDEERCRC